MREVDAQAVLLVKAFEEADDAGLLLSLHERNKAGDLAKAASSDSPGDMLIARAWALMPRLHQQVPGLERLLRASRLGRGLAPLVILGALLLGFATNALGEHGRIHILFAPMFGLVVWNLAVYVWLIVSALRNLFMSGRRRAARQAASTEADGGDALIVDVARRSGGMIGQGAEWILDRALTGTRIRQVKHQAQIGAALTRFAADWRRAAVPLIGARLARLLHLGSIVLVGATVAGMYVRGLGLAYRATWESTFLGGAMVDRLLGYTLGPAATVMGWELPSALPFEAPETDDAARWIHLYAVTGLLFIVIPRVLLMVGAWWSARHLARDLALSLDAAYFRRLLAPVRGGSTRVDVVPCSLRLGTRASEVLVALLHDVFGSRAAIEVHDSVPYGEELPDLPEDGCTALLFSAAQSPEAEVHGRMVHDRSAALGEGESLLVLIDGASHAERVGADSPRVAERRRAWDRVISEVGPIAVHVDLSTQPAPELLPALSAALWPVAATETA